MSHEAGAAVVQRHASLRKLKILVAEDHAINRQYMGIMLAKLGHEARFCENGEEALNALTRERFDVVLLDFHMPVLDGLATTQAIRRMEGTARQTKVILVTGDVTDPTRKRAMEVGVNEFASKPLQAQDLQRALSHCDLLYIPDDGAHGPAVTFGNPFSEPSSVPHKPRDPASALGSTCCEWVDLDTFLEVKEMMPEESLNEWIDALLDPITGTVHALSQAVFNGDRTVVATQTHQLKGAAMLLGLRTLAKTLAHIEQIAAQHLEPIPLALGQQLIDQAQQTHQALLRLGSHRGA